MGRPKIDAEIRALIRKVLDENPNWGAPRIHGEFLKLGFHVTERTVSRYLRRWRLNEGGEDWKGCLRITDAKGEPLPDLSIRLEPLSGLFVRDISVL